jgi:8-oxo-dGTP pyrophosphatase MutT (NUDIX family)
MSEDNKKIGWVLYNKDPKRILLHRRDHKTKNSPDTWDCFGGEIENGETEYDAFLRELHEELGITTIKEDVEKLSIDNLNFLMYLVFFDMNKKILRLGEGAGFAWLPIDYALSLIDITNDAKTVLKKLNNK